jgi:hypothetical protein
VRRTFTAAVHLYSPAGARLAAAECLLYIDVEPFATTIWGGELSSLQPERALAAGEQYLLRLPNGQVRRVTLGAVGQGRAAFDGEGTMPL